MNVKYIIGNKDINNTPLIPFDKFIIDFTTVFSKNLISFPEIKKYPDIVSLAFWTRKANIVELKNQYKEKQSRLGRGLVFHITPSNVPVNFAFSYLFALLAGNASIVRLSSKFFPQTKIICDVLNKTLENYPEIKKRTNFVSYNHQDLETTQNFSDMADVRIIWGGDETIKSIRLFQTKPRCTDITFADRYSLCILNCKELKNIKENEMLHVAELFYNDTYLMDQNACSSPQLICFMNADAAVKEKFWSHILEIAKKKYHLYPSISAVKYLKLCKDIISCENIKKVEYCDNVVYRVEFSSLQKNDLTNFRGTCGYFYEYNLSSLDELTVYVNEKYQTITYYGINPKLIQNWVLANNLRGIDRIVPVGKAMDIGLIWDGYDLIRSLSRVVYIK
jgi:hypothetical protein